MRNLNLQYAKFYTNGISSENHYQTFACGPLFQDLQNLQSRFLGFTFQFNRKTLTCSHFLFYTFSQYLVHSFVQRNCRFSQRKQLDLSHNWPISPLSLHRIFFNWMSKRRDNALVTHFSTQGDAGVDGTVGPPGPQVSQSTKPLIV